MDRHRWAVLLYIAAVVTVTFVLIVWQYAKYGHM